MTRCTGTLTRWISHRGFGFVEQSDGKTTFVHISAFPSGTQPAVGDKVEYSIGANPRTGKECAIDARVIATQA